MENMLKELCSLAGVSGNESPVAEFIKNTISPYVESVEIDRLGSVVAFKKGKKTPKNKVMIDAHIDEVGFMVTGIEDDGFLRFITVGGIDAKVIIGRRVLVGPDKILGVIGTKAVHMQSAEDRKTMPSIDSLRIDIGAKDKESAEKHVSLADTAVFDSDFVEFGDGFVKARAIDDRIGCAVMIKMIQSELEYDTWFSFSVQEEIGGNGAKVTSFTVQPDYAIVLEGTTAADFGDVPYEKQACSLGDGAVVTFMDRGTLYDPALFREVMNIAKEKGIKAQAKRTIAGGNNAASIHHTGKGAGCVSISAPCRYIHSASCVHKVSDFEEVYKLTKAVSEAFSER